VVKVNLNRESEAGIQSTDAIFYSNTQTSTNIDDIDVQSLQTDLTNQLDLYTNLGSGWSLVSIDDCTINIARYNPLVGSSYIDTPRFIKVKRAVINVTNKNDEKCFQWAVLSALYPVKRLDHPDYVSKYRSCFKVYKTFEKHKL